MNKFLKWFNKYKFLNRNGNIPIEYVLGNQSSLSEISKNGFIHSDLIKSLEKDLIILIVDNNFIVDPSIILTFFKRRYNFTVDEFSILSFKMGMLSKMYIENPTILLQDAIKLKDVFSKDTIENLKVHLEKEIAYENELKEKEFKNFQVKLQENKKEFKLKAEDIEANRLIDEWLAKQTKKR